ncbi:MULTISPECIES: helix-turn-helix domain-containing protein [Pantoea]|jgi:AraC-like DNA-binding protein|uniref:helix-turn-helix domain-containing protein n=1 Tax=Pantoea TaxID=53335 RepID=UPI001C0620F7|nr:MULTISPECIES: helix-turn-helix domain-containing protein [Pantoea]
MNENKYNEGVIISITEWINNNLNQRLSINDIAEKSGYSKWYLQKLFARYHHETLARYIRKRKLAACVHDLKNSNAPIISLAVKYHFESQQSFTRSFKQVMGCTPSVCRKRQLNAETQAQLEKSHNPCALCFHSTKQEIMRCGSSQRMALASTRHLIPSRYVS